MGWDLQAFFDIDQDAIEQLLVENNIDRYDWGQSDVVGNLFKKKYLKDADKGSLFPIYNWNSDCQMHEIYDMYSTNFIRDDERFENRRYHALLEKRVGARFPECLKSLNWTLRTAKDAIDVADALNVFFANDKDLSHFARWLRATAKYCSTYELSY